MGACLGKSEGSASGAYDSPGGQNVGHGGGKERPTKAFARPKWKSDKLLTVEDLAVRGVDAVGNSHLDARRLYGPVWASGGGAGRSTMQGRVADQPPLSSACEAVGTGFADSPSQCDQPVGAPSLLWGLSGALVLTAGLRLSWHGVSTLPQRSLPYANIRYLRFNRGCVRSFGTHNRHMEAIEVRFIIRMEHAGYGLIMA